MADLRHVGIQLRRARLAAGLTMRELAERAGLSYQLVEKLEAGRGKFRWDSLERLTAAAGGEIEIVITPPARTPKDLPVPIDRLAVATRLLGILGRLPEGLVDQLVHDIALWETEYPPEPKN